eukprot:19921-Pelagomonas_calceolata.AAC.2
MKARTNLMQIQQTMQPPRRGPAYATSSTLCPLFFRQIPGASWRRPNIRRAGCAQGRCISSMAPQHACGVCGPGAAAAAAATAAAPDAWHA